MVVYALVIALVLFWFLPMTFITGLTSEPALASVFPGMTEAFGPEFIATLAYWLGSLVLSLFTSLTPFVFQWGGGYKVNRVELWKVN